MLKPKRTGNFVHPRRFAPPPPAGETLFASLRAFLSAGETLFANFFASLRATLQPAKETACAIPRWRGCRRRRRGWTSNFPLKLAMVAGLFAFTLPEAQADVPKLSSYTTARATVFLDFDGHVVRGTGWNWDSTIRAASSGLSSAKVTEIFNRVSEDYRIFNINITTDPNVYAKAPLDKRVRIILTPTYEWYGPAGGVAFINSFVWGDETPAWVFTSLLNNDPKYIGEAASHEIGHTLGLNHQSTYTKTCGLTTEYAEGRGTGEIGWAPIMGVGYYKNFTTWTYGSSIEGCKHMQNDIYIISKGVSNIGMRTDDHANVRTSSTVLTVSSSKFAASGIINSATDKDFFKITLSRKSRLKVTASPYSVAAGASGANVDVLMTLIKSTGDTLIKANPKTLLSAAFDTLLSAGTYYIGIDGISNQNVSDYGSVGTYSLSGTITATTTTVAKPIQINGNVKQNLHLLNWESTSSQTVARGYLEASFDGIHFVEMTPLPEHTSTYSYEPSTRRNIYYRVRLKLPDDSYYYSNTIILGQNTGILVGGNVIRNEIRLNLAGDYQYQLVDAAGRLIQQGKLTRGLNTVPVTHTTRGLLMLKVFSAQQQFVFRLIRQ